MIDENLDTFLADFGEVATRGGGATFTGIYERPDLAGKLGDSFTINTRAHTFLCKTADAKNVRIDAVIEIERTSFVVLENHPDGTGCSVLVLTPADDGDTPSNPPPDGLYTQEQLDAAIAAERDRVSEQLSPVADAAREIQQTLQHQTH